jgi:IclR family transcriptional regulator, KDG regulon repressor
MDSTLVKGLGVLEALARSPRPRSVSSLAADLGLTRSNAHRTLKTLVCSGYARQDDQTGGYECTLKLFELATALPLRATLTRLAEPVMQALSAHTQETVHLSALEGDEVVYLEKIDSPQPVRAYTSIGGRAPAYCVATGKALLAFQPDSYVDRYDEKLTAHTEKTVPDLDALRRELEQVRYNGFAINRGEWRAAVRGLAAPIFQNGRRVTAAIGISGPAERLSLERLAALAPEVVAAARSLTLQLDPTAEEQGLATTSAHARDNRFAKPPQKRIAQHLDAAPAP